MNEPDFKGFADQIIAAALYDEEHPIYHHKDTIELAAKYGLVKENECATQGIRDLVDFFNKDNPFRHYIFTYKPDE